jgi:excisionase family DNA binding protein
LSRSSDILTTHQVAEKLGVNPVTVARWVKAGKLPAFKTAGGHRRIRKEDLDHFLEECGYYDKSSRAVSSNSTAAVVEPGTRVLIVDDEADIVNLIQRTIQDLDKGYVVESANDGFMAGYLVRSFTPQIVFLDLKMDGIDGFEVCKRIKNEPSTASSHIIAVTGFATQENREKILANGAAECLAKPIGPTDIREALNRAAAILRS